MTPAEVINTVCQRLAMECVTPETVDSVVGVTREALQAAGIPDPYERALVLTAASVSVADPGPVVEALKTPTSVLVYMLASDVVSAHATTVLPKAYDGMAGVWGSLVKESRKLLKGIRAKAAAPLSPVVAAQDDPLAELRSKLIMAEDSNGNLRVVHSGTAGLENCKTICESLDLFGVRGQLRYDVRNGNLLLCNVPGSDRPVVINGPRTLQPMWLHTMIVDRYGLEFCPQMQQLKWWADSTVDAALRSIHNISRGGLAGIAAASIPVEPYDRHLDTLLDEFRQLPYDEVRMWWDGVPRIDTLFQSAFTDCQAFDCSEEYLQIAAREMMLAPVYRLIGHEGCVLRNPVMMFAPTDVQTLVYIYGDPGAGKTELFKMLFGFFGVEGFLESLVIKDEKDTLMKLHSCVVACCDELSDTWDHFKDANERKNFITRSTDTLRRPYGTEVETVVRRCSIVATGNTGEIVSSKDTDRRVIPVGHVMKPEGGYALRRDWVLENRLQLFAEAVYRIAVLKEQPGLKPQEQALVEQTVRKEHRVLYGSSVNVRFALEQWINGHVRVNIEPRVLRRGDRIQVPPLQAILESLGCGCPDFCRLSKALVDLGCENIGRRRVGKGNKRYLYHLPDELYDQLYDPDASIHDPTLQALAATGVDIPPPVE